MATQETGKKRLWLAVAAMLSVSAGLWLTSSKASEAPHLVAAPAVDEVAKGGSEVAVLAGGCFWGVQGVFQHVKGVSSAVSGYAGGDKQHADYEMVSTGTTGHAESVRVTFDPSQVSYGKLLQIYFSVAHDPTELNRQGPDSGTQYRSQIFATSPEQAKIAKAYIAQLNEGHAFGADLATRVDPLKGFYPAEAYHQDFLTLHPDYPYIAVNDIPKVAALRQIFPNQYRSEPVLVAAK
jgi:peptide-methionine (S)-S-oxide reductase